MNSTILNAGNPSTPRKRERSEIAFPYTDFDKCLEMADAVYKYAGLGECSKDQLAAWIEKSANSSVFRNSVSAAKLFGLLQKGESFDKVKITELGVQSLDSSGAVAAKAKSFLRVPLFEALFQKYKNYTIPPTKGLEADIESLGVPKKQKIRARQVFEASAKAAGFKEFAQDKLVMPIESQETTPDSVPDHLNTTEGLDDTSSDKHGPDPLIQALLDKIPIGEEWPSQSRLRWFRTFAMIVSQVYDTGDQVVELKIELEPSAPEADC